jgi:hypothetical protein
MPMHETLARLGRLVEGAPSRGVAPDLDWGDLIGPTDLLRRELRRALDSVSGLRAIGECWDRIAHPACEANFARAQAIARARRAESIATAGTRLYRHAVWLVASAGAAAVLRWSPNRAQVWDELALWWRRGVERFGGPAPGIPSLPRHWKADATAAMPLFAAAGWDVRTLGYWTAWWHREPVQVGRTATIPLAGYWAGAGFLADLALASVHPRGGYLVEHPEGALRPLGDRLVNAVTAAAGTPRRGIAWRIAPRAEFPDGTLPLDGDSLGAAAYAGFHLLDENLSYDPLCLLLAAVDANGELRPVGGEKEKLSLARAHGFRRAAVAFDSDLSNEDLALAGPPVTWRLRTARDARDFARPSHRPPLL